MMQRASLAACAAVLCCFQLAGEHAARAEAQPYPDGGYPPQQRDLGFIDDSGEDGGNGFIPPPDDAGGGIVPPPEDAGAGVPLPPDSGALPDIGFGGADVPRFDAPPSDFDASPSDFDADSQDRDRDASIGGELDTEEPSCGCTSARAPHGSSAAAELASLIAALALVLYAGRCRARS